MGTLLISLLTLVLLLISAFIVLVILMQRTSQNGGMGAALGGGAAESAFGSDTNNILTKATIYGTIAFFVVSLSLYLLYQAKASDATIGLDVKTLISADAEEPAAEVMTTAVESADAEGTLEEVVESVDAEGTIAEVVESVEAKAEEAKSDITEAVEAATTDAMPAAK